MSAQPPAGPQLLRNGGPINSAGDIGVCACAWRVMLKPTSGLEVPLGSLRAAPVAAAHPHSRSWGLHVQCDQPRNLNQAPLRPMPCRSELVGRVHAWAAPLPWPQERPTRTLGRKAISMHAYGEERSAFHGVSRAGRTNRMSTYASQQREGRGPSPQIRRLGPLFSLKRGTIELLGTSGPGSHSPQVAMAPEATGGPGSRTSSLIPALFPGLLPSDHRAPAAPLITLRLFPLSRVWSFLFGGDFFSTDPAVGRTRYGDRHADRREYRDGDRDRYA